MAVVTGGGTGIGRAVALALAKEGYAVAVAGRRRKPLDATVIEAKKSGAEMLALRADVRSQKSVRALFTATVEAFGRVDLLFNNAGADASHVELDDITLDQWRTVVDTNITGTFLCTQEAFRVMKLQKPHGGRIINNGSVSAQVPRPRSAPYTTSKHGITGLTKATSLDGRRYGIACGQIDIGNARTKFLEGFGKEAMLQPSGRLMAEPRIDVEHVARAIVYMASLPLEANVQFMTVMATTMPFVGRG